MRSCPHVSPLSCRGGARARARLMADRYEPRLSHLPHAFLVQLAAEGMRAMSDEARRSAEEVIAAHSPVPAFAVAQVLTAPDLVGCLLQSLGLNECRAARVCTVWRHAWSLKDQLALGQLRVVCSGLGSLGYPTHVTPRPEGGVLVPDYENRCLQQFSTQGQHEAALCEGVIPTPSALALMGDGTAWVIASDEDVLVRVHLTTDATLIELSSEGLRDWCSFVNDLALAGDALLVLSNGFPGGTCIAVLSAETGEMRFSFGEFGSNDAQLRAPESLMVCTAILCTWRTCATTAFRSTSSPRTGGTRPFHRSHRTGARLTISIHQLTETNGLDQRPGSSMSPPASP